MTALMMILMLQGQDISDAGPHATAEYIAKVSKAYSELNEKEERKWKKFIDFCS